MRRNKRFDQLKYISNRYPCKNTISIDAALLSINISASEYKFDCLKSEGGKKNVREDLLLFLLNKFAMSKNFGKTENFDIFKERKYRKNVNNLMYCLYILNFWNYI